MLRQIRNRLTYANVMSTTRSNLAGRWLFPYRFGATVGTVKYRFRARLPVEGGYPFATGHSPVVRVLVRGG